MARWGDDEDWDDDPEEDFPDEEQDDTAPCPYCGRAIHDDAVRCPYCENYLSREDEPYRKPWWMIVGVIAGLYAIYRGLFLGF